MARWTGDSIPAQSYHVSVPNKGHMFSNIGVTFINVKEATSIFFLPLHLIQTNNHSSEIV
jgi:hypothetical protein